MSDEVLGRILRQLEVNRTIPSTAIRLRERAVDGSVNHILTTPQFADLQVSLSNLEALRIGLRVVSHEGQVAEFGVYTGTTLTAIVKYFPDQTVHGFDSFVGLPESWSGTSKSEGSFDIGGEPPDIPVDNVDFHVGFFDTTVPEFAASGAEGPFVFAHLDADLYSSTKTVFDTLGDWFIPGTVIVFDEYFGYHGWENHEHRAFMEFLEHAGLDYRSLAIGHMNLSVQLIACNSARGDL